MKKFGSKDEEISFSELRIKIPGIDPMGDNEQCDSEGPTPVLIVDTPVYANEPFENPTTLMPQITPMQALAKPISAQETRSPENKTQPEPVRFSFFDLVSPPSTSKDSVLHEVLPQSLKKGSNKSYGLFSTPKLSESRKRKERQNEHTTNSPSNCG